MDTEMIKSITKTGSVVSLSFLALYLVVDNIFQEAVYKLLGSEKIFIIILVILAIIFTVLLSDIFSKKDRANPNPPRNLPNQPSNSSSQPNNAPSVNYKDSSTHNGDNRF